MLLGFQLMIQNGEYNNFFLYTVFFKKEIVQRGQTYQVHALTLKSCAMFKRGLKWERCSLFFWGLLIIVVILTSFSNYSRRFYLYLYFFMTFHDLLLVSNETTNRACCTVNTLFVCLLSSLILSVSCLRTKKKVLLLFLSPVISLLSIYTLSLLWLLMWIKVLTNSTQS